MICTVPIHESNDCHNPAGPGGGRFCSGVYDVSHDPSVSPSDLLAARESPTTYRFLYFARTNTFILGGRYDEGSHAEDLMAAEKLGADPTYDEYVKGYVTSRVTPKGATGLVDLGLRSKGDARLSGGQIRFVNAEMGSARNNPWEDPAVLFDRNTKAVQFFLQHGAAGNTVLDGVSHFLPGSYKGTIKELLPEFVKTGRKRKAP